MEINITPASEKVNQALKDPIEQCVLWVLERFDKPMSAGALRARVARLPGPWSINEALEAIDSFGIRHDQSSTPLSELLEGHQLLFIQTNTDQPAVIIPRTDEHPAQILLPQKSNRVQELTPELQEALSSSTIYVLVPPEAISAGDSKTHHGRYGHWFFGPIYASRKIYSQVLLAALLTNIFALTTSGFSMIVYDRVMPNGATDTLIALVFGVFLIFISDFIIRTLRAYFLDTAGAQADMIIADTLFEQMVDMELKARKGPVGSVANSLREFETLREFMTSATMTTFIDIPFSIIFLLVIWAIGGPIVYIPLVAILLVVVTSLVIHPRIKNLTQTSFESGQTKHAIAIETLQGIETIKAMGAGSIMRRRWQDALAHQSVVGLKTRMLAQVSGNVANFANQFVWVGTVVVGIVLVERGNIAQGAIIACSMLAGRAVAPMAQLSQLLTRLNQSLASYRSLSALMQQPREHRNNAAYLNREVWQGSIEFKDVSFRYPDQTHGGLQNLSFKINAGESVAVVGKVGSGKTTVAKLILGLYQPDSGAILIDGIDTRQIDPADLRRNIGVVMQDVWLMTGTVKHNIGVGGLNPTDEDILEASEIAGVHEFIAPHPDGYGLRLKERGEGLSGGQKQALAIARALVSRPPIMLMDEPTSAMDMAGEKVLIDKLKRHLLNQTIVIITHRASIIELVDRVIVIDQGKLAAQGPKADFMKPQQPTNPNPGGAAPQAKAPVQPKQEEVASAVASASQAKEGVKEQDPVEQAPVEAKPKSKPTVARSSPSSLAVTSGVTIQPFRDKDGTNG